MATVGRVSIRFRTVVARHYHPTSVLPVPAAVMLRLGLRRRVRVQVSISGYQYTTTITSTHDWFFIPLGQARQRLTEIQIGDEVEVEVVAATPDAATPHSAARSAPHTAARHTRPHPTRGA